MATLVKTYIVVSSLPVVVEDAGVSLSYQPGAVFMAKNTNPSVLGLLEDGRIVETTGSVDQGFTVIQGQQGPEGPTGPTGPSGPPGGLPAALAIDNTTAGLDVELTDGDAIVGQSDGGWDIGSPDGGTTPLRPAVIYVQGSINVGAGTTVGDTALNPAGAYTVETAPSTNLDITAGAALVTSNNPGGVLTLSSGAGDGAGADGTIDFQAPTLVADMDSTGLDLYDSSANKVIEVVSDPGALRVGRNTQLTLGEGDAVFGNDGTLTGAPTGLMLWDADTWELGIRNSSNARTIDIDGSGPEVALYDAGVRGLRLTTAGGVATLRADNAADRTAVDTVLDLLIKGGDAEGTEDGGALTLEAGRGLGTGADAGILLRTGNMDRWELDLNGNLLASTDNGYNIGAVGASRPLRVYVGTEVVVGNTVTISTDTITASGALNLSVDGAITATAPASTAGAGAAWSWTAQTGEVGLAGVSPTVGAAGGTWLVVGGTGGAADGTDVGGETGGDAGAGGTVQLMGGPGGSGDAGTVDPGQPASGGPLWLFGGPGGNGAGTSDNADGADVVIRGGPAGTGGSGAPGVDGDVIIGDADTTNVVVGSGAVSATSLIGSVTTVDGGVSIDFDTGGATKWSIDTTGHLLAAVDDTYDIGASGATRPRRVYAGTEVVVGNTLTLGTDSLYAADGVGAVGGDLFMFAGQGGTGFRSGRIFICAYQSNDVAGQSVAVEGGQVSNSGATDLRAGAGQFMGGTGFNNGATGEVRGGHALIRGGLGLHNTTGLAQGGSVYIEAGYGVDEVGLTNKRNPGSINIGIGVTEAALDSDLQFWNGDTLAPSAINIGAASTSIGFFGTTAAAQQADTVALTDNSGGTADSTIAAITQAANAGSADIGPVADAIADLAAKYNALRDLLRAYGLMA